MQVSLKSIRVIPRSSFCDFFQKFDQALEIRQYLYFRNMGGCMKKPVDDKSLYFIDENEQHRFNCGKPIFVERGLNITKNPITNELQGIPEEWVTRFKIPLSVDRNKVIKTKNMREQIRPDQELPLPIIQLINKPQNQKSKIKSSLMKSGNKFSNIDGQQRNAANLHSSWYDSLTTSFDQPQQINSKTLADIISKAEEDLKESAIEKYLLSTEEFQNKIQKVKFIEDHPTKNFIFRDELGHGGACKVFQVQARYSPHDFYAVRIMKQKNHQTLKKIRCQIAVMQLCQSPNIVQYYFTYYYRQSLFMFIEYMDAGCLTKFVKKFLKSIPENIIAYIIKGILKGLKQIHKRKQIHRDLKSDNILINQKGEVKIADFGYALQLTSDKLNTIGLAGTPAWMAPELIMKSEYNEMVDIWSLGIIVLQLCNGEPPYLRMQPIRAMYKIASENAPKLVGFSPQLTDFVCCCLKKDPTQRYSASDLLQHRFIKSIGQGFKELVQFKEMVKKSN